MDDPMKLDLEEAMQRIRRFCELRPSYPDYAMIAHSDYSDAIRMGHLRALCVPPEVVPNGWNEAIDAATKMLRSSADNCQPGSPAETHNWPFVLETMARKVEGLKLSPRSPLARKCRHGYREENCGLCHPELEPKETPQSGA